MAALIPSQAIPQPTWGSKAARAEKLFTSAVHASKNTKYEDLEINERNGSKESTARGEWQQGEHC